MSIHEEPKKATRRALSPEEMAGHLREQISFLEQSVKSFDEGFAGEAKRIAVTLRVLMHSSRTSHSLLGQLGKLEIPFLDTALPEVEGNMSSYGGLVFTAMGPPTTRYVAMLDTVPVTKMMPFSEWWTKEVFRDSQGFKLSRKDLVLTLSNQDGGAHVDPKIDETYYRLSRENALGMMVTENGITRPMEGPERAAMRQIAHEALKTLIPGYAREMQHEASVFAGGMTLRRAPAGQKISTATPSRKVRRNEQCPCGSGSKYKRCHGR